MAKATFRAESKREQNKKIAIRLLISLIVLMSLYFGCVKAGFSAIQNIYIYGSFVLMMTYALFAVLTEKEKRKSGGQNGGTLTPRAQKYNRLGKYALILFIPMIFALLLDYMLILTGLAKYFGI